MPEEALGYELSLRLSQMFPNKYILETEEYDFDLDDFAARGYCSADPDPLSHIQLKAVWNGREQGALISPRNGACDVVWQGRRLKIVIVAKDCSSMHYIIADDAATAKAFFSTVCLSKSKVSGKILVFSRGSFRRDETLLNQISTARLEHLTLTPDVRNALIEDIEGFFGAKQAYAKLRIPWKRGVLLLGPPGNGKTQAIKAMLNRVGTAGLYVRSFMPQRGTIHGCISDVFKRAREAAPCMLILEDLDSLVDDRNRSFFLNEMDGFALNEGVLTVATTNHPKKLDPALLNRPSRFDRKIVFTRPDSDGRKQFLLTTVSRYAEECRLSEEDLEDVVANTDGFSFAYLKELCLSSQMAWMRDQGCLGNVMLTTVAALRQQMKTEPPPKKIEEGEEEEE